MGVSISDGGNVDLNLIIAGGPAFTQRLDAFRQASEDARAAKAALTDTAENILEAAKRTQAAADQQLAENRAAAEQLREAQKAAEDARTKFETRYDAINAAARN